MNRIKEIREKSGLTLKQLSIYSSVSLSSLSAYERSTRSPKIETWKKLSDALGVSVPYLQGISDDPSGKPTQADFLRWDDQLADEQVKKAKTILDAISPDSLASLDFEQCSNRLGTLEEALTFMNSNPKQAFDLWGLLILLNGYDDSEYPLPSISDDFKQQVLNVLS